MPEENWTFGVGSVSVDPLCPLSASSTSSPLIAGWRDAVTVLILSLPLLGRKMCLNLWRYLFPIVSIRLWKLSPQIMSLSLICLPALSTVLCEVRFSCETQQLWKKILPTKPPQVAFLPSVMGVSLSQALSHAADSPLYYLPSYYSFSFHNISHFLLLHSHFHIPGSDSCDVHCIHSLLPPPLLDILIGS